MPVYRVELVDAAGRRRARRIAAPTRRAAMRAAEGRGEAAVDASLDWPATLRGRLRRDEVVHLLRFLGRFTAAGRDWRRALRVCAESDWWSRRTRRVLEEMHDALDAGASLAEAFAATAAFTPEVVMVVEAGASSARLPQTLEALARDLEARGEGLRSLVTRLIYPALVGLLVTGVGVFIVTTVLPEVAAVVPPDRLAGPTRTAVAAGRFLLLWWPVLLAAAGALLVSLTLLVRMRSGDVLRTLVRVPLVRRIVRGWVYGPWFLSLGLLLGSGVPMARALETIGRQGPAARSARLYLRELERGRQLHEAVAKDPMLGPEAGFLLRQGAEVNRLAESARELGAMYRDDLEILLARLSAWAEPAAVMLAGGVLILIFLAVRPLLHFNPL